MKGSLNKNALFCRILFFLGILLSAAGKAPVAAATRDAVFDGGSYKLNLRYNDSALVGDAVFVRMEFSQGSDREKSQFENTTASLELYVEGRAVRESDFYTISESTRTERTFLSGIPLSTWWTSGTKCSLKVTYNVDGTKPLEFDLPFALEDKDFVEEVLDLDENNTNIRTDTSPERMNQIRRLNDILATVNSGDVYQTSSFTPPTEATRRTSFFADRRVYKYTNGGSATSLHYGIDYGVPTGSEVRACADGRVVLAETRITTGWSVVIEHLPGLYSLYYHMSELKVKEGDVVESGQLIGLSGATGLATGPHLHWEMRLNGEAVSPDFFTGDFAFTESE